MIGGIGMGIAVGHCSFVALISVAQPIHDSDLDSEGC